MNFPRVQFKTNAPLRYSVKPVLAVLQPNASLEVYGTRPLCPFYTHSGCDRFNVLLHAMLLTFHFPLSPPNIIVRSESPINPSDRFLIQSVSLTEDEAALTSSSTWKQIDRRRLTENFINCSMMRGSRPRSSSAESLAQPRASGTSVATKNATSAGTDEMVLLKARVTYRILHVYLVTNSVSWHTNFPVSTKSPDQDTPTYPRNHHIALLKNSIPDRFLHLHTCWTARTSRKVCADIRQKLGGDTVVIPNKKTKTKKFQRQKTYEH